jgi:hypothetical protein
LFDVFDLLSFRSWYCWETQVLGKAALFFALFVVSLILHPR